MGIWRYARGPLAIHAQAENTRDHVIMTSSYTSNLDPQPSTLNPQPFQSLGLRLRRACGAAA
jgi:hypothetical protein